MKNWNKLPIFAMFAFLFAISASAQTSKTKTTTNEKWDSSVVAQTIAHIFAKGKQTQPDEMKFVLPTEGYLLLQGAPGDAILKLVSDTLDFSIFLAESKNFKGNQFFGVYASRFSQSEHKKIISAIAKFLANFAKTKPLTPQGLFDGKDPLTLSFVEFTKKMEKITPDEVGEHVFAPTDMDIYLSYSYDKKNISLYYAKGENTQLFFNFNVERPILHGTFTTDPVHENGKKVTEKLLREVFASGPK